MGIDPRNPDFVASWQSDYSLSEKQSNLVRYLLIVHFFGGLQHDKASGYTSVCHKHAGFRIFFLFFFALRRKSTAMVMAGQSVHLTTLFPGQA